MYVNLTLFLCSDHILQHLWFNLRKPHCKHKSYEELIHHIRLTEREWNPAIPLKKTLRYLRMVTNANINTVQFMTQRKKRNHECSTTWCSIFKYQFQNALVKLLFELDFLPAGSY